MFVCTECGYSQRVAGRCATDGTPLAPIGEDMLLGTTIGVYRVARLLGIGGMGRVYKGVHPAIGSRVAIKVLSRECSDRRELVERFFAEAKAVNLIRHEGIVNVLDQAMLPDGRPYIIMEYLDGVPLATIIEHGVRHQAPLPLGGIARLIAEVLDALGAAHAKGIVHRDLKPDNVFVAPSGRPKVLDFGIAKLSDVSNTATRTGSLMGTPHYMAPEQAAGRVVDHRADIYAIGVMLFECATGRKPFVAEALFDLLRMQVEAPPPPPRAWRPDMPPDLEHVILTALAKAPDQRFSSTMAMSAALHHATAQLLPEDWRPLLPPNEPGAREPSSGNWAPTPPVSWSGPTWPPPSAPGSAPPAPPMLGNAPTESAGQVTKGARPGVLRKPSKRGLWIAIAAAAVGGAGIAAAAVVLGGGGNSGSGGNNSGATSASGGSASGSAATVVATEAGHPADPSIATNPAKHDAPTDESDDEPDDGDDDTPAEPEHSGQAGKRTADPMDEAFKQIEETIRSLPPDQQKRLAGYKDLAKLPPKDRMKRLQALIQQGIPGFTVEDIRGGLAEAPPPPPPPTTWITNHELDPPSGYEPAHLDVTAFIPWAIAQAKKAIPDAQLIRIDADGVSPDGRANLALPSHASDHGSVDIRFISPSRGKRDPSQPLGVGRRDYKCEFRIMATPSGVDMMPIDFLDCAKERVVPVPRCSLAGVWTKAIQRKAPSQDAVGSLGYRSNGSRAVWYFDIGSGFDKVFSQMFGDDCK